MAKSLRYEPPGDIPLGFHLVDLGGEPPTSSPTGVARGGIPPVSDRTDEWWNAHTSVRWKTHGRIDGPGWVSWTSRERVRVCPPGVAGGVEAPQMAVNPKGSHHVVEITGWDRSGNRATGHLPYVVPPTRPDDVGIILHAVRAWGNPPCRGREFRRVWNSTRLQMRREGKSRRAVRAAWKRLRGHFDSKTWHTADPEGLIPAGHWFDCTTGVWRPTEGWLPPYVGKPTDPPVTRGWVWRAPHRGKPGTWVKSHARAPGVLLLKRAGEPLRVERTA